MGVRRRGLRRSGRASCRSPTAPAARRASAPTPRSRASSARRRSSRRRTSPASRRRAARWTRSRGATGMPASATSWRCAAIRRRSGNQAGGTYAPHPGGYANAAELVAGLARIAPFEISVAAYPETHPEARAPNPTSTICKRKLDAGACRAITQYFFGAEPFLRFRDRAVRAGVEGADRARHPAGHQFRHGETVQRACGASVPDWLAALFDGLDEDPETRKLVAATVAAEQVRGAAGRRRRRVSFLHAEPRRPRLRDLPHPRRAVPARSPGRLTSRHTLMPRPSPRISSPCKGEVGTHSVPGGGRFAMQDPHLRFSLRSKRFLPLSGGGTRGRQP